MVSVAEMKNTPAHILFSLSLRIFFLNSSYDRLNRYFEIGEKKKEKVMIKIANGSSSHLLVGQIDPGRVDNLS